MGMDFAFLSTSRDRSVAENFGSAEKTVIFEVLYIAACPGVDVQLLSLYPAEGDPVPTMHRAESRAVLRCAKLARADGGTAPDSAVACCETEVKGKFETQLLILPD
jgi:hypothetical protein